MPPQVADLSYCGIKDSAVPALAQAITSAQQLQVLDLSHNLLSPEHLTPLMDALRRRPRSQPMMLHLHVSGAECLGA